MLTNYPDLRNKMKKCVRCGLCRAICPIFEELGLESAAPRGKVFLAEKIHQGDIKINKDVKTLLSKCLMCEACAVECPSNLPVPQIMAIARQKAANELGFDPKKYVFQNIWSDYGKLRSIFKLMWGFEASGLRSLTRKLGFMSILPGDLPKAEKLLNDVPKKTAREQLKTKVAMAKSAPKYKVAYFLGCGTDMINPDVAMATVRVLQENQCEVHIPDIKCCGMPQMANGAYNTALDLAKVNIDLLLNLDVDYIVSDCGTCSAALNHTYPSLFTDEEYKNKAKKLAAKTLDISKFLVDIVDYRKPKGEIKAQVTYHDPCHLVKAQKISKQPRTILKSIPGINLIEMDGANRCCGGAGTFILGNYDISSAMLKKKVTAIEKTGAELVSTSCPMCTMQLSAGLTANNYQADFKHPIQLLDQSYQQES